MKPVGCGTVVNLDLGLARFSMIETVKTPLTALFVQFQPVPIVGGQPHIDQLHPEAWDQVPVTVFVPPLAVARCPTSTSSSSGRWSRCSRTSSWRCACGGVDERGGEYFSGAFAVEQVQTEVIQLHGFLDRASDAGSLAPTVSAMLAEAGLDPSVDKVIWGTETVKAPLASLNLLLHSTADARYATPRTLVPAAIRDGVFIFRMKDWQACLSYFGRLTAVTEPFPDPTAGRSPPTASRLPIWSSRFPAWTWRWCRARSSPDVRRSERHGGEDVHLHSPEPRRRRPAYPDIHRARRGRPPDPALQRQPAAERPGLHLQPRHQRHSRGAVRPHRAAHQRQRPGGGPQERLRGCRRQPHAVVDRTPPTLAISYPLPGQRVCGVRRDLDSVVDLQALIQDASGFAYILSARGPGQQAFSSLAGDLWVGPQGESYSCPPTAITRPDDCQRIFSDFREIGTLATLKNQAGDFLAHLEVVDNGGFRRCADTSFYFDGAVEGPADAIDRNLISPNGDGVLDDATVTFRAAEPVNVDVKVYPAHFVETLFERTCPRTPRRCGRWARRFPSWTPAPPPGTAATTAATASPTASIR